MWTIYAAIVEMIGKLNHTDHMNLMSQKSRLGVALNIIALPKWRWAWTSHVEMSEHEIEQEQEHEHEYEHGDEHKLF